MQMWSKYGVKVHINMLFLFLSPTVKVYIGKNMMQC